MILIQYTGITVTTNLTHKLGKLNLHMRQYRPLQFRVVSAPIGMSLFRMKLFL